MNNITQLRKNLHTLAEPSMQEHRTKRFLMNWLRENTNLKLVDRGNWFYAVYEPDLPSDSEQKSKNADISEAGHSQDPIAFRADFDAVLCQDGIARHLCGHDGHSAALASFAAELEKFAPDRTVYLIFQPGEETGEGARLCSALIEEKGISEIYGFHNIPGAAEHEILLLPGTFACASTGMELTFQGSPSHAAYPEQGKNPGLALADMLTYSQELLKEQKRGIVLATIIGADLGSQSYGVSAEKGVLRLTLRAEYQDEYDQLLDRIRQRAEETAHVYGLSCSIRLIEEFPATENDPACVEKVRKAAEESGLKTRIPEETFRWSEDFGYYLQKTKGAIFGVGAGTDHPGLHTANYEYNDAITESVLKLYKKLCTE
ncbi:MAG: amidohydrolase [Lachnospiraceae bacterium]|nr:amidohydrolase [Lachnospiraceae bacterium]